MASPTLHQLAERYWQGELSPAEEQALFRRLQVAEELPSELLGLQRYAAFRLQQQEVQLGADFDARLLAQVRATQTAPARTRRLRPWLMGMAAALALTLGITATWQQLLPEPPPPQPEFVDTYQDPQEAYRAVRTAMLKVSRTMNEGMAHTEMIGRFHEAKEAASGE